MTELAAAPGSPVLVVGPSLGTRVDRLWAAAAAWTDRAALVRTEGRAPMVASSPGRWFGRRVRRQPTEQSRAAVDDLALVDPESYALVCDALGRFDVTDRLREITTPLLAVAGADDLVTPPAQHQQLARAVPDGRFAVLRGVGHLAPLEDPRRTAALLREHFGRTTTAVPAERARL